MQLLTRAPTRYYFVSIFIIVSIVFIAFSATVHRQHAAAQRLIEWTMHNYEAIRQSRRVMLHLVDMETGVRGYMLSDNKRFLEAYQDSKKALSAQIKELLVLLNAEPNIQETIVIPIEKIEQFSLLLDQQIKTYEGDRSATFIQQSLEQQKLQMDEVRSLFEDSLKKRREILKRQIRQSKEKQEIFRYTLAIGTVLAVGGLLLATVGIISLVERNRRAEEAAREVENRFLAVITGLDDGVYDFNLSNGSIYYSPSYKTMLGYTEEELPNTVETFNRILHPDDYDRVWDILGKYREGKTETYSMMYRLRHKDGNWIWVLSRGVGLKDDHGKMIRLIGTHTDITEQKNREEELQRLNKEMETFTYIASHDLRAPLVNLKGFASEMQLAITKLKSILGKITLPISEGEREIVNQSLETDIPESLRFIVQSVEKMDALTTAVLDLSRIGRREYHFEDVDTQAIVKRCLDTLGYEISQKEIDIVCHPLPSLASDPLALEQIFSNVLDNAVKYLEPGRKGKIEIGAREDDNHVIFQIQDNGRGIAAADKDKVFQIFRRARNTADVRGRGMGMTFVQATLRKLGGAIWFDSIQGQGTRFYLRFPKHPKTKAA